MPDASGENNVRGSLSGLFPDGTPSFPFPFGLDFCGFVEWLFAGVAVVGIVVATAFAVTNNHEERRFESTSDFGFEYEIPGFNFDSSGLGGQR